MGAAKSSSACASVISNQVISVGTLAYTISTLGTGAAATAAANGAKASKIAKLKEKLKTFIDLYNKNKDKIKAATTASKSATIGYHVTQMSNQLDQITIEDVTRLSAEIASLLDPTGLSSTVAAYSYPKCHKYF